MVGTPSYRLDPGKYFRDLNKTAVDAFTADNTRPAQYRPWSLLGSMPADTSLWESTVSDTWGTFYVIGGPNSHPRYTLYFGIVAPSGGSVVRGLWADGATVLFETETIADTSGVAAYQAVDYDLSGIPNAPSHYESFYFYLQARSVTTGNGTSLSLFGSFGVEPTHSAAIPA